MKVIVTKASDDNYSTIKNFNTLEDLINFMGQVKHPLIISHAFSNFGSKEKNECEIEVTIYDDWVE